ncbi:MAG: GAF domain-containing sensor histidine kinase [Candidatus Riflebacteria bacterium]|nr:GAF domain-containing sensor histidine kinase [Candidatus Riflebacteria bacterium]
MTKGYNLKSGIVATQGLQSEKSPPRLSFEKVILDCSTDFLRLDSRHISQGIAHALQAICIFTEADHASIFQFEENKHDMGNSYEWCNEENGLTIPVEQTMPINEVVLSHKSLRAGQSIHIRDVCALSDEFADNREKLLQSGFRSLIAVPMYLDGRSVGFLSLKWKHSNSDCSEHFISLLQIMAQIIANLLDRKRMEDELRAAKERAEEASRAKTQFLTMMSHELRTPLTVIRAYATMFANNIGRTDVTERSKHISESHQNSPLGEHVVTGNSGEAAYALNGKTPRHGVISKKTSSSPIIEVADVGRRIVQSCHHLAGLIDGILDFASIEADRFKIECRETDLSEELEFIQSLGNTQAAMRNVTFRMFGLLEPVQAFIDPSRLRQILGNVIANAFKFTPDGVVELKVSVHNHDIEFVVADTGIGISPDELEKVWEPFYQVSAGRTRRFGGIGLGLAISKRIVNEMGGEIGIKSALGKGSTVTILFPGIIR